MQIEMSIKGLMVDPVTNMPIVILRDQAGQKVLPIWVGMSEANAIALQIENISTPRPNTLAEKRLADDVPEAEKTRRIVALQALQREIQTAINGRLVGRVEDVLIDSASRRRATGVSGRTSSNVVVNLPGDASWIGQVVPVRIERAGPHSVGGRPANVALDTARIEA